jgi:hypothetical protein
VTDEEYFHQMIDARIHAFITENPLALVPAECAIVPTDGGVMVDHSMMHRIRMFNSKVFDRLTADGYKLNMVEGRYEKNE